MIEIDKKYMREALIEAKKAYEIEEVPIGAIIVYKDTIIGRGYNRRNIDKSTLAHAEIIAMQEAFQVIGDWRLEECTMYITLEPCPMCAGAIVQARIPRVVVGANNYKSGSAGTILNILQVEEFNHQVEVEKGVLGEESKKIMQDFFKKLRSRDKKRKKEKQVAKSDKM